MRRIRLLSFAAATILGMSIGCGQSTEWEQVFNGAPGDLSKWIGAGADRVEVNSTGFVLKGDNMQPDVVLVTSQKFSGNKSYRLSFSNLRFGTRYNNVSAYFDLGFCNIDSNLALGIRLTRFGDSAKFVFNYQEYDLDIRPYLNEGGVDLQVEYDSATKRVSVVQSAGKYKKKGQGVVTIMTAPVTIFEKQFAEPLDLGANGGLLMVRAASKGNGGYAENGEASVSNMSVTTNP